VRPDTIRLAHRDATLQRVQRHGTILVLQDTTELHYTAHPRTTGLGHLDNALCRGLKVHSGVAATVDGVPLGLLHQAVWTRDGATKGQKKRKRPQAEKESQRWLTTLAEVQAVVPPGTRLIVVADREADSYPLFIAPRDDRTDLVIRATYDRGLVGGLKLDQVAAQVAWAGTRTVAIPGNGQRQARTATVQIGWTRVHMLPPTDYPMPASAPRPALTLVVVVVVVVVAECAPPADVKPLRFFRWSSSLQSASRECAPPADVKPLRWVLWTTLPVHTWDDAVQMAEYYRARWLIERYHYVLKSGCGIKQFQLETGAGLEKALVVCGIVAWRLLWLTYQARQTPDEPCTTVFATHEWQALVCTVQRTPIPPSDPPTLHAAVRMVARLGGFLARTGDGEPGVKTIWRGLIRLDDIAATWLLLRGSDPAPT